MKNDNAWRDIVSHRKRPFSLVKGFSEGTKKSVDTVSGFAVLAWIGMMALGRIVINDKVNR